MHYEKFQPYREGRLPVPGKADRKMLLIMARAMSRHPVKLTLRLHCIAELYFNPCQPSTIHSNGMGVCLTGSPTSPDNHKGYNEINKDYRNTIQTGFFSSFLSRENLLDVVADFNGHPLLSTAGISRF